jgi:hypothetical protein
VFRAGVVPNAVPVYEALGAGRGRCANTTAPPRCSPFNYFARATLQPMAAKWLGIGGLVLLGFGVAGCAALIVGSVVGSVDLEIMHQNEQVRSRSRRTGPVHRPV